MKAIFPVDYNFPYMGMTLSTGPHFKDIDLGVDGSISVAVRSNTSWAHHIADQI